MYIYSVLKVLEQFKILKNLDLVTKFDLRVKIPRSFKISGHCFHRMSSFQFWDAMSSGVVPVVYGGANYSLYAPPHSYINVDDFQSVEQLGEHLR